MPRNALTDAGFEIMDAAGNTALLGSVRSMLRRYADEIGVSLDFQRFEQELDNLSSEYAPPAGTLFVAWNGHMAIGCIALRPIDESIGEIKRMYVLPQWRGRGAGSTLLEAILWAAVAYGYSRVRLDTLGAMHEARRLYVRVGFTEIPAYYDNPIPGAKFYELRTLDFSRRIVDENRAETGAGPFELVVHNDDVTTQLFVLEALQLAVKLSPFVAWASMWLVHGQGRHTVRRYPKEKQANRARDAILNAARHQGFPLRVTVERSPDLK